MSQKHYYEATGKLKKQLQEWRVKAKAAREKMFEFAKQHGCDNIYLLNLSMRPRFTLKFPDKVRPDPKVWKHVADRGFEPKTNIKAGIEIHKQMEAIAKEYPSGEEIAKLIDMEVFRGFSWHTPGLHFVPAFSVNKQPVGERALLTVDSEYKVPDRLKRQLKRISDIQYEKLTAEDPNGEGITTV